MVDRRAPRTADSPVPIKSTPLPKDYLKLVVSAVTDAFKEELAALGAAGIEATFEARGDIYPDEVLLRVCLAPTDGLGAVTVHASSDFPEVADPQALEPILAACLDAVASLFAEVLTPARIPAQVRDLSPFPSSWAEAEVNKRSVHLLVDGTHLAMEQLADEWLAAADETPPEDETRH